MSTVTITARPAAGRRPAGAPRTAFVLAGGAALAAMQAGMVHALYERRARRAVLRPRRILRARGYPELAESSRQSHDTAIQRRLWTEADRGHVPGLTLDTEIITGATTMESANRTGPVHYRTAAVGGVNVFYREAGPDSGPVLLLLHGFPNQAPTFKAMQQFLRERRPPTLVATGANDEIFPEEVGRQILTDHPGVEYHALRTGHFALEDKAAEIAALMRDFLARVVPRA